MKLLFSRYLQLNFTEVQQFKGKYDIAAIGRDLVQSKEEIEMSMNSTIESNDMQGAIDIFDEHIKKVHRNNKMRNDHQIATSHGRSEKAISMRFATILQKKLSSNDKDKKQLMQDFSLSPRDLEYYLTMESSTFAKSSDPSGNFDARIQTLEKKIVKLENIIKKLYNKVVQK